MKLEEHKIAYHFTQQLNSYQFRKSMSNKNPNKHKYLNTTKQFSNTINKTKVHL